MTTPSNTVQRLQIVGTLVRMGGMDVTRLQIECDDGRLVEVSNVASALLSDMPMLLYKRVRLTLEAAEGGPNDADSTAESEAGQGFQGGPAPAEDPERAAYLRRWEVAPAEAAHLWQAKSGECFWLGEWFERPAGTDMIGRALVEPRPEVQS